MTDRLYHHARVLTMDDAQPQTHAVLVRDALVAALGDDAMRLAGDAERVDCDGALLVPAFVDAHCHLLATAAASRSVDCSPQAVTSIADIQRRLREAVATLPPERWLRATGYDETQLAEHRHPTHRDLDAAVPDRPVRLLHRSGHAVVLNTPAMRMAAIATDTPEPAGGHIERFAGSGEPTGLLLEMNDVVDRVVPPLPYDELAAGVRDVAQRFLATGVTEICDATHTNGRAEWELFARLQAEGHLPLDVTLMEGVAHAGEMPSEPAGRLRRGHVKVVVSEVGGLTPDPDELARIVRDVHASGRDVAVHAVEEDAVGAALDAIEEALRAQPRPHRHRIEHAGLVPDSGIARMARLGVTVVTQPAFVAENAERYRRDVPPEKHGRLYAIGDLLRAGVAVAASSDAPHSRIDVAASLRAATERRGGDGVPLGPDQSVDLEAALRMWTRTAAESSCMPARGVLTPGAPAEIVLLSEQPLAVADVWVRGVGAV